MGRLKISLFCVCVLLFSVMGCVENEPSTQVTNPVKERDAVTRALEELTSQFDAEGNLALDENPTGNIVFDFCFTFVYPLNLSYSDGSIKQLNRLEDLIAVLLNTRDDFYVNGISFPFNVELFDEATGAVVKQSVEDESAFEALLARCEFDDNYVCIEVYDPVCVSVLDPKGKPFTVTYPNSCYAGLDGFSEDDFLVDCKDKRQMPSLENPCFEWVFPLEIEDDEGRFVRVETKRDLKTSCYGMYDWTYVYPRKVELEDGTLEVLESEDGLFGLFEKCKNDAWEDNCICTKEYDPVCVAVIDPKTNAQTFETFSNPCMARCAGFTEGDFVDCSEKEKAVLAKNKRLWTSFDIRSYRFDLLVSCYCLIEEPYSIKVVDGLVTEVSGNEAWGHEGWPMTLDALFEESSERLEQTPFISRIKYHKTYGYPTHVFFDMEAMMADEEVGFSVSNFEILPLE